MRRTRFTGVDVHVVPMTKGVAQSESYECRPEDGVLPPTHEGYYFSVTSWRHGTLCDWQSMWTPTIGVGVTYAGAPGVMRSILMMPRMPGLRVWINEGGLVVDSEIVGL
jgi:hypothetical protein